MLESPSEKAASTAADGSAAAIAPVNDETKAALLQTAAAVGLACVFCAGVFATRGVEDASAWFAAYVLEESLSIDNLFVFSLIFDYFQTPSAAQPRVLRWGLIAAVVLRLSFICAGLAVVEQFKGVLLVFAGILLYSAYGLLTDEDDEPEDLSQNPVVKLTKQYLPSTDTYDGDRFFTTGADGVASVATPLLLALVCVEISDVIFAVDSIPAVFGVTTDPFIAFTSNAFALLGLRALYTIISQAADDYKCARARALHLPPPRRRPPPRTGRTPSLPRPRPCPRMHPTDRQPTARQPLPARHPTFTHDPPCPPMPLCHPCRSAALLLRCFSGTCSRLLRWCSVSSASSSSVSLAGSRFPLSRRSSSSSASSAQASPRRCSRPPPRTTPTGAPRGAPQASPTARRRAPPCHGRQRRRESERAEIEHVETRERRGDDGQRTLAVSGHSGFDLWPARGVDVDHDLSSVGDRTTCTVPAPRQARRGSVRCVRKRRSEGAEKLHVCSRRARATSPVGQKKYVTCIYSPDPRAGILPEKRIRTPRGRFIVRITITYSCNL